MVHLLSYTHPQPCPTRQSTRYTSSLHRNSNKIIIIMNSWHRSMKNTEEEPSLRRTAPLQDYPSLARRAHLTPLRTFTAFTDNQYRPLTTTKDRHWWEMRDSFLRSLSITTPMHSSTLIIHPFSTFIHFNLNSLQANSSCLHFKRFNSLFIFSHYHPPTTAPSHQTHFNTHL